METFMYGVLSLDCPDSLFGKSVKSPGLGSVWLKEVNNATSVCWVVQFLYYTPETVSGWWTAFNDWKLNLCCVNSVKNVVQISFIHKIVHARRYINSLGPVSWNCWFSLCSLVREEEPSFHAALMLCLIAGGDHHAPWSGKQGGGKTAFPRGTLVVAKLTSWPWGL